MSQLVQDLRHAARVLARAPGYTAVALLTLALAIGANTAIFSVVDGVLLEPLPFPEAGRLVQVMRELPEGRINAASVPKYAAWREGERFFAGGLAAYESLGSGFNLTGDGPSERPERLTGSRVSRELFAVLGVAPARGRGFTAEEDRPGGPRAVVLSDGLWHRRFGADPGIVGRALTLNGEPYTVAGVMPAGFRYPAGAELWTPFQLDMASQGMEHYFEVIGRLRPGVAPEEARAGLEVIARRFAAAHPEQVNERETVALVPLRERLYGEVRPALLVLLGAVGCVLLIACVNVANLQLARAAARQREIAVRTALGAGARQIVRHLLTESLLLGLAGGAAGLVLGRLALRPLLALAPESFAPLTPVGIDGSVLAFTLGLSLLAGVLFGLAPALQSIRPDLHEPLKEASRSIGGAGGPRGALTRRLLVAGEVAVALVLLTAASLLVKSFAGLVGTDPGFTPERVLTLKLSLPEGRYGDPAALERFTRQVRERILALPGVREAAFAVNLPMEGGADMSFVIEGRAGADGGLAEGGAQYRAATPGFFRALGIPVLRGRDFAPSDGAGGGLVALVNETLAQRYWPGEDPVGRRIHVGLPLVPELADPAPRTIVGVVRDVREAGLGEAAPAIVYVPLGQMPPNLSALLVRLLPIAAVVEGSGDAAGLARGVQQAIWAVDPQQPVTNVRTMAEVVARTLGPQRFNTLLLGALALVALTLAAVGIYGVLSYLVAQRTREIGVRMALGATGGRVLALVVRQGLGSVLAGVAAGLAGAFAATRLLQGLLVGVSAQDPLAFVLAPALLTAVALLASAVPARRASRLDPLAALRQD